MLNYFELMGVPVGFALDKETLQANLRALQSQFHPDSQQIAAESTNVNQPLSPKAVQLLANLTAEQQSAVINEAYQALVWPDSRAKHLLALQGIEQSINQPIRDLDFLDDAMAFRVALDESTIDTLGKLRTQLGGWLDHWSQVFVEAYTQLVTGAQQSANVADHPHATLALDSLQKLQFLVKLAKDVDKRHDELAQTLDNDDDLYV